MAKTKPSLSELQARLESARKAGPRRKKTTPAATSAGALAVAVAAAPPLVSDVVVAAGDSSTPPPSQVVPGRSINAQEQHRLARKLLVRKFVRAFLNVGESSFMSAKHAMVEAQPEAKNPASDGWKLLQEEDCKEEMLRQLKAIDKAADMDDQWVYDRWRAIANANIFDFMSIDSEGKVNWKLDPTQLTQEQQMVIREVRLDSKTGRVVAIKLANLDRAVENVARARQMIEGKRDASAVDLADRIRARMARAAQRTGRVFDNDSGEQVA